MWRSPWLWGVFYHSVKQTVSNICATKLGLTFGEEWVRGTRVAAWVASGRFATDNELFRKTTADLHWLSWFRHAAFRHMNGN